MMDCGRDNRVECPDSGNVIEAGEVEAESCADLDMVVNGTENEAVNMREGAAPESNTDAGPASDDEEEEQVEFRYEKIGTH